MKNKKVSDISNLENGMLFAILSFFGYVLAYFYEYGYLSYFKMPTDNISLGLERIFLAIGGTFLSFFIFLALINLLSIANLLDLSTALKRRITVSAIVFLYFSTELFVLRDKSSLIVWVFTTFFSLTFYFIWPMVVYKGKGSLEEKIKEDILSERKFQSRELSIRFTNFIYQKWGKSAVLLFSLLMVIPMIAKDAGLIAAHQQKKFNIINYKNKNLAIIRIYNDKVLAKTIDLDNQKLLNEIYLLDIKTIGEKELEINTRVLRTSKLEIN